MSIATISRITAFLDAHHVVALATCGSRGPHAANVLYARDGLALIWVSDPRSRHSMEIETDARIAATIAPDCADIAEIRGLQILGNAHAIRRAADRRTARRLLERRYPGVKELSQESASFAKAYARMAFYRLEPERIVLIDNNRGFAHKDTLELTKLPAKHLRELPAIAPHRVAAGQILHDQ